MSNPIQAFINDECKLSDEYFVPVWYLYEQYDIFREVRGHQNILQNEFSKIVESMGYNKRQKWFNSKDIATYKKNQEISEGKNWLAFEGIAVKPKLGFGNSSLDTRTEKESEDTENEQEKEDSSQFSGKSPSTPYIQPNPILPLDRLENKENSYQEPVFELSKRRLEKTRIADSPENTVSAFFSDSKVVSVQVAKNILKEGGY